MIFRKLADVKREQELADKSKTEQQSIDLLETASTNSTFKKIISKFRKRSVDSRADTDVSHSIDNVGMMALANAFNGLAGGGGGSNTNNANQNNSSNIAAANAYQHHYHSNSIVSLSSSSTTQNNNNSNMNNMGGSGSGMLKSLTGGMSVNTGIGGDSGSSKSISTSTLALATSASSARLLTINEKHEGNGGNSLFQTRYNSSDRLPILPPLSQAHSVKQKWNILLSKAKGGVENIPKAFLISEISEMNEIDALNEQQQQKQQQLLETQAAQQSRRPSFKITMPESQSNEPQSNESPMMPFQMTTLGSSGMFNRSLSTEPGGINKCNLLTPMPGPGHLFDASGGFSLLDSLASGGGGSGSERHLSTTKSSTSDGLVNSRNPQQLLGQMIEYRQELKADIENLNGKIGMIDKKIVDMLRYLSDSGASGGGGPGGGGGGGGGGFGGAPGGGSSGSQGGDSGGGGALERLGLRSFLDSTLGGGSSSGNNDGGGYFDASGSGKFNYFQTLLFILH